MRRHLCLGLLVATAAVARATEPPLQDLARHAGRGQGVFARAADGTVLVAQAEAHPVHPASVTKVATSLALLDGLGPDHRFETRLVARGPLDQGTLAGDLVVEAGRDPFLVSESAFVILRQLAARGVAIVDGSIRVHGPLLFNWQPDPDGARLIRTLTGHDSTAAWSAAAAVEPGVSTDLGKVALRIRHRHPPATGARLLLTHRSPPLLVVLKHLNEYSNNVFHLVADAVGGARAVEAIARKACPGLAVDEIVLTNGAGAGTENRLSPRAAVGLVEALHGVLERSGHDLPDALPVSGVDPGTLSERLAEHPAYVVGKTGTFGSVGASALAGVLRTARFGRVTFAVLNHGVPVPDARARQDAFVRALIEATGATPWPYTTPARPDYIRTPEPDSAP